MWSPVPRPKVIRRPRPLENFTHQRRKLVKRKNPLEFKPENHYGNRYFGIRHSDITDYLERQVPSHAFAPAIVNAGRPTNHGRGQIGEQVRPSTAPAAIPWFGRTSSDVSDWLRPIPPAHLGADPDNKPLPYFPTKSSIVTDNRWQTRDFPPVPNILWHYWADRPSSAPLATAPNHVQFDTILDAIKKNRPMNKPTSLNAEAGPQSGPNTPLPRSARSNPNSRAETPRTPEPPRGTEKGPKTPNQSRPTSAAGGRHPPQPGTNETASGGRIRLSPAPETPIQCYQCGRRQVGHVSGSGMDAGGFPLCKACGCGKAQDIPRSPTAKDQEHSPRSPKRPGTPLTGEKAGSKPAPEPCLGYGYNTVRSAPGTPRPQTPKVGEKKPALPSQRPPTCPSTPKQKASAHNGPKTPPIPFHEVIRNSRKAPDHSKMANGNVEEATAEEFRLMSPNSYATKDVWQNSFRKQNRGSPWPIKVH